MRRNVGVGRSGSDAHDAHSPGAAVAGGSRRSGSPNRNHGHNFQQKHAILLTGVFFFVVYIARSWRGILRNSQPQGTQKPAIIPNKFEVTSPPLKSSAWRGLHQSVGLQMDGSPTAIICGEGQLFYADTNSKGWPGAEYLDSDEVEEKSLETGRDECCRHCTEKENCNAFSISEKICSLYRVSSPESPTDGIIDNEDLPDEADRLGFESGLNDASVKNERRTDESEQDDILVLNLDNIDENHKEEENESDILFAETETATEPLPTLSAEEREKVEKKSAAELGFAVDEENPEEAHEAPIDFLESEAKSLPEAREAPPSDLQPEVSSDLVPLSDGSDDDEAVVQLSDVTHQSAIENLAETEVHDTHQPHEEDDSLTILVHEKHDDDVLQQVNTVHDEQTIEHDEQIIIHTEDEHVDLNPLERSDREDLINDEAEHGLHAEFDKGFHEQDTAGETLKKSGFKDEEGLDLDDLLKDLGDGPEGEDDSQIGGKVSKLSLDRRPSAMFDDDLVEETRKAESHDRFGFDERPLFSDRFPSSSDEEEFPAKPESKKYRGFESMEEDKNDIHDLAKLGFGDDGELDDDFKPSVVAKPKQPNNPVLDDFPMLDDDEEEEVAFKPKVVEPVKLKPTKPKVAEKSMLDLELEGKNNLGEEHHNSLDELLSDAAMDEDPDNLLEEIEDEATRAATKATVTVAIKQRSSTSIPSKTLAAASSSFQSGSEEEESHVEDELEDVNAIFPKSGSSAENLMSPEAMAKIANNPIKNMLVAGVYGVTITEPFYQQKSKFFGRFRAVSEIHDFLAEWQAEYSKPIPGRNWNVDLFTLGKSGEGKIIKAVEFGNPNRGKHVFVIGGLRGCDWVAPLAIVHAAVALVGRKRTTAQLLDAVRFHFVPLVNVDGYHYSRRKSPSTARHWCDNRRISGGGHGVNLERNWGEDGQSWGFGKKGKDGRKDKHGFQGLTGFSEPETRAVRDYIEHFMKGSGRVAVLHVRCCGGTISPPQLFGERAKDSSAISAITQGSGVLAGNIRSAGEGKDYQILKRSDEFSADNTGQLIDWTASRGVDHSYALEIKALSVATYNDRYQINPEPFMALCKELEVGIATTAQLLLQQVVQGAGPGQLHYRPKVTASASSSSSSSSSSHKSSSKSTKKK